MLQIAHALEQATDCRNGQSRRAGGAIHPRSRGEHILPCGLPYLFVGSSPLARGTPERPRHAIRRHRFIPARAGNTCGRKSAFGAAPVHPRSRGEHAGCTSGRSCSSGSSPLARGTRLQVRELHDVFRFIPARAGNTDSRAAPGTTPAVHPRSRGEHTHRSNRRLSYFGSSPLARGTPRRRGLAAGGGRFIPARAGNTMASATIPRYLPVHPRSRGEHAAPVSNIQQAVGSSPLARGTPGRVKSRRDRRRFIPARAGNTVSSLGIINTYAVHPRSRGEHSRTAR